jgi:hypothetical protein
MEREVIVEKHVVDTSGGGEGTASNAIWAIAFVIIVAIIAGAVYYSGILRRVPASQKIDVKVSAPAAAPAQPPPAPSR